MRNCLTDISGLRVGHAHDETLRSGVTAVIFDRPAIAAASLLGGAPAVRDTALLALENAVERIDAIV
ncbi:P1 family peptidase, partial [Endobacter medicaginis]